MPEIIIIKTGELAVAKENFIIKTGSIGSCVVIAIYDNINKTGGLAHAMLPKFKAEDGLSEEIDFAPGNISAKYADRAVENLVAGLKKMGSKTENMEGKLVGGASMFKKLLGDKHGIGFQNIESAREKLHFLGINIENEDTGGSTGKSVEFNLLNGVLQVTTTL